MPNGFTLGIIGFWIFMLWKGIEFFLKNIKLFRFDIDIWPSGTMIIVPLA
jgi:hypothetical protein